VAAVTALLPGSEDGRDGTFTADLRKILGAAERLGPSGTAASPGPAAQPSEPAPARAPALPGVPQARILVVDDGAENRDVLRRRLERSGHAVETAEHGRIALELLAARSFDLVLLDVLMPELDGSPCWKRSREPALPYPGDHDLGAGRNAEHRSLHRARGGGLPPQAVRSGPAPRTDQRLARKKRLRDQEVEYLREVGRVIEAATAVEAGTYRHGALGSVAQRADELGRLARVFDSMVLRMKAREERLRDQVRGLRQDIEEVRRTSKEFPLAVDGGNLHTESGWGSGTRFWRCSAAEGWGRCIGRGTSSSRKRSRSRRCGPSS
jgi:hypothetical protein